MTDAIDTLPLHTILRAKKPRYAYSLFFPLQGEEWQEHWSVCQSTSCWREIAIPTYTESSAILLRLEEGEAGESLLLWLAETMKGTLAPIIFWGEYQYHSYQGLHKLSQ